MVKITFLRHGESIVNVEGIMAGRIDCDLTEKGINQAKELSENKDFKYDIYYCSPLKRTHQTLNAIFGKQEFIIDERLNEVDSGDWQGKLKSELPEEYILYLNGKFNPPNGEKLEEVDNRTLSFLKDIFNKYTNDEKILAITHNALMRNLRRLFFETEEDSFQPRNLETITITKEQYMSKCGNTIRKN